jgi:beta-glucosidase/6-phospho-beta-glucosidase/beta-galactosidase
VQVHLMHVQRDPCRYHPAHIVITENGVSVPKEQDMRVADATRDSFRVDYYRWASGVFTRRCAGKLSA